MRKAWVLFAALAFCACGRTNGANVPSRPEINPRSFALVPCGPANGAQACVLAIAGGKRVLFGAPAGVTSTLTEGDLQQLDAVMLFSLGAGDLEGLDEVRNASWRAGRDVPLLVVGPDGTDGVVHALNRAFEQADAMRIVAEGMPPGGFDAAVLTAQPITRINQWARAFDTGDLLIEAKPNGTGHVIYGLTYTIQLAVASCGGGEPELREIQDGETVRWLGCEHDDLSWPLRQAQFIVKN